MSQQEELEVKMKLLQDLEKQLICYDCQKVIFTIDKREGYRCHRMHLLCDGCKVYYDQKDSEKKCPCGSNTSRICPLVSELSKNLPYFCQYHKYGCPEIFSKDEMEQHHKECVYTTVDCITCSKKVAFIHQVNHLENECTGRKHSRRKGYYTHDGTYYVSIEELTGDLQFFAVKFGHDLRPFYSKVAFINGMLCHWIYFVGTKEEAKRYRYRITARHLENFTEKSEKIVYTGQVRSIFEPIMEIIKDQNALMFGEKLAKRLANDSKYFAVDVELLDKKVEFKDDDEESGIDEDYSC